MLAVPAVLSMRGRWQSLWRNAGMISIYGLLAVAGGQVFYFNAIQHLSVGVALLLEYLGTILVVGWMWIRHGHKPHRLTGAGSAVAIIGLVFVLNLIGGQRLDPVGVLWGLAAAFGLATYFVLSSKVDNDLPPVAMASAGMTVGAVALLGLGAAGVLPMHATFGAVHFVGQQVSWLVPVLGLSFVAAAIAYVAGIGAARRLGPKLATFVGLTEVIFAVLFAWLLLGELPTGLQLGMGVRTVATSRRATIFSSTSPVPCPSVSLICLNPSRSRYSSAIALLFRRAWTRAIDNRSASSRLFASPVSGSCSARDSSILL